LLYAHRKIGRGPAVAGLFFVVTLFPALGFVNVYPMRFSFVADHFQYLACIAPIALAAAGLARLASRAPIGLACLLALGFLKLGMMTWNTSGDYHDAMTLWNSVVSKDEHSVIGHCDLGIILVNQGYRQEGIDELRQAVSLDPRCVEAWIGLGQAAEDVGHFDAAEMLFSVATQNVPESPLPPWQLGLLHKRLKQYSAAMVEFATAANGLPNPAPAYEMIGEIELIRNHLDAAAAQFNRSIQYDPDRVDAHNNLAAVDLAENSTPSSVAAEAQCRAGLAIDPRDTTALNDLGIALARQGRTDEAADCFEQTLKIDPGFAMARENLRKLGR
jgi:tetratricopeptide (TPR) repeat protein